MRKMEAIRLHKLAPFLPVVKLTAILSLLLFYLIGTYGITIKRVKIRSVKVNNEVNIVQLTDLHGASFYKDNDVLYSHIESLDPDFIVITGDMYTKGDEAAECRVIRLIERLSGICAVFIVNGEHDDPDTYRLMESSHIEFLDYESKLITVDRTVIRLYGITNVYFSDTFDLRNAFLLDDNHYTILLAHIPNIDAYFRFGTDLTICGDTHGGMIRFPLLGAIYNKECLFPELDGRPLKGIAECGNSKVFISSGLGNYPIPIRLFNSPEIVFITLIPE